jgi:hypothetical protein
VGEDWHASINKQQITGRESVFLKIILNVFNSMLSKNRDFIKIYDAILKLLNGILIALIIILIYLQVEGFSFTPILYILEVVLTINQLK